MPYPNLEPRRGRRRHLTLDVRDAGDPSVHGRTRNLSSDGLGIEWNAVSVLGEQLSLQLSYPGLLAPIRIDGSVEWSGDGVCGLRVSPEFGALDRRVFDSVTRTRLRVLMIDPRARRDLPSSSALAIEALRCIGSLKELRMDAYDICILPVQCRDSEGRSALAELLLEDLSDPPGARRRPSVVAVSGRDRDRVFARTLGADVVLSWNDVAPWLRTASALVKPMQRVAYV